jgi:NAD/NADP transhydrogenase beta subunit
MSVEGVKLNIVIWLLLGLVIGVVVGLGVNKIRMKEVPEVPVANPTFVPGRVVNITIDQSQQEELFAQLQKFATSGNTRFESPRYLQEVMIFMLVCGELI